MGNREYHSICITPRENFDKLKIEAYGISMLCVGGSSVSV